MTLSSGVRCEQTPQETGAGSLAMTALGMMVLIQLEQASKMPWSVNRLTALAW